jgi:hypothetical protein
MIVCAFFKERRIKHPHGSTYKEKNCRHWRQNVEKISRVETIENSKKRNEDDTKQHHQGSLLDSLAAR